MTTCPLRLVSRVTASGGGVPSEGRVWRGQVPGTVWKFGGVTDERESGGGDSGDPHRWAAVRALTLPPPPLSGAPAAWVKGAR